MCLAQAIGFDDPGQITVGMKVGGVEWAALDTVDAAVQWARHLAARFDQSGDQEELASAAGHLWARISALPDPRLLDAFVTVVYRQFLARRFRCHQRNGLAVKRGHAPSSSRTRASCNGCTSRESRVTARTRTNASPTPILPAVRQAAPKSSRGPGAPAHTSTSTQTAPAAVGR